MVQQKKLIGRDARLQLDNDSLIKLSKRSKLIEIEPIGVVAGRLPEKYLVTFRVRSIVGIKENSEPIFDNFHQVEIYLDSQYPRQEPRLKWKTEIWHPNIEHLEPKTVCTQQLVSWNTSKDLEDLIIDLAEMAQYKIYHAKWISPFPRDVEVAKWVREYAEPNGIIGPNKPTDNRPLLRKYDLLATSTKPSQTAQKTKSYQSIFELGKEVNGTDSIPDESQLNSDSKPAEHPATNEQLTKSDKNKGFELGKLMK